MSDVQTPVDGSSIEALLAAKELVVLAGPGGVGKTTMAAAAGLLAAQHLGGKVLVLTVDPARRLATALGLEELGNAAARVPEAALAEAGIELRGELWAAQLDTKQSWDDLIRRHAPDAETRDAILSNALYENVTGKFVQSHDYIAMERLHELHTSGEFDLIVVDTPPSRNAMEFLDAPNNMADFFGSRLLRWLTVPYRSRAFTAASKPFYNIADRVLGQEFLREIADFFLLFQTMHKGFVGRAKEVQRTLKDRRTTFVVVTTLEAGSVAEAEFFVDALAEKKLHLGAVIVNRELPDYLRSKKAATSARKLVKNNEQLAKTLGSSVGKAAVVRNVLAEVGESFLGYRVAASRQEELRNELRVGTHATATVPIMTGDITSLASLAELGQHLR